MDDFVKVARATDLEDGEIMLVEVGEERILVSKMGGSFYAVGELCTHALGPLSDGYVEGQQVECPWHGSRFDLQTGEATNPPATKPLRHYAVRVEDDDILVGPSD